ncbi:hypothetical protein E9993_01385 [Labilibacter sediminis]|nr:hypothetical protein E9993_01385 [Labilibacter sediminis]
MNIYYFLEKYGEEINQKHDSYDSWEKWNYDFLDRTHHLQESIVKEFFIEINSLIANRNFKKATSLCKVFNTGYFEESTEDLFLKLILSTKEALYDSRNKNYTESIYSLQFIILDLLFHEYLYSSIKENLEVVFKEIKNFISNDEKINSNSSFVIQKIEQIKTT